MRKFFPLAGALILFVSLSQAAETPESISFSGAQGFQALSDFKPIHIKSSRYVHLSGSINLSGNTFVPQNTSYAYVNLSGSTNLTGDGYQTGYTTVNQSVSIWVNSNYVSQFVQVNVNVQVYKDGRYVGSTYAQGSVNVSGWKSGDWINLSGFGTLNGNILVQE
ncbi:MAG: hypothetical protein NTX64_02410 [Elusimicrobia bacterium]|nr:hypothetical protein [Elusimicrobiota bacterium]